MKKGFGGLSRIALLAFVFVLLTGLFTFAFASTKVTVHYFRYNADYAGWNMWMWPVGGEGKAVAFTETDSYGRKAVVEFDQDVNRVGFLMRKGDWQDRDISKDRFVVIDNGVGEVWLIQGDEKVYTSRDAVNTSPKITGAFMDTPDTIYAILTTPVALKEDLAAEFSINQDNATPIGVKSVVNANEMDPPDAYEAGFEIIKNGKAVRFAVAPGKHNFPEDLGVDEDIYLVGTMNNWGKTGDKFVADSTWKLKWNKSEDYYEIVKEVGNGQGQVPVGAEFQFVRADEEDLYPGYSLKVIDFMSSTSFVKITTDKQLDASNEYTLSIKGFKPANIQKRGILTLPEFTYTGDDLGAVYTKAKTTFRVWAPTAKSVALALYPTWNATKSKDIPMKKDVNGTWIARIQGDIKNTYYMYKVNVNGVINEAVDPYAKAVGVNGNRGMVVDLASTNPKGWDKVKKPIFKNYEDAIIYEVHVRDLTINPNSGVDEKYRGKFMGFTQKGTKGPKGVTTGLDHLKELGITHVHLLPSYDYATTDEANFSHDVYNWGYDPKNYNVPEGSYSTDPVSGVTRIKEFKEMVKTLHENGIRVIMDVVYNHTYSTGDSWFDMVVPKYYYRTDKAGNYTNGSGCNNETASEKPMMGKYIVDSVKYWAKEYGVDGFRFDLMALHDIDTMKNVEQELHKIDPSILIYGEPWTGGTSGLNPNLQLIKGAQSGMNIAVFNDNIRNTIKGDTDGTAPGFATGQPGLEDNLKMGIAGSIDDFTNDPGESINYATAHDNYCLWDKISRSNENDSLADRKKMDKLANGIVLTAQGIAFIHGGEDILRTKQGNHNSYNAPDDVNNFDWQWKADNLDVFNFYKGVIALRKAHPAFRMTTADDIRKNLQFIDSPAGTVSFALNNNANGDAWKTIVVVYNPTKETVEVNLPDSGKWTVVVDDDEAGVSAVKTGAASFADKAVVPAISMMVLYKN